MLVKLSELIAKNILEVNKELDQRIEDLDNELVKTAQFAERAEFFKTTQELINEYKEKLRRYKEVIGRPAPSKPKDKFKRRF